MIDYNKYLDNRVVIISGVGRSGTTILGKIIGSAENTFYFFEPAIMKYFPAMYIAREHFHDQHDELIKCFKSTLFEDYILPAVQGRNINFNPNDWSYYANYTSWNNVTIGWSLKRRNDALEWIEKNKPTFVFKVNDSHHLYNFYNEIFNGLKVVNINRNMIETVCSSMERGWFKDNYDPIDLTDESFNIPVYVEINYINSWIGKWNPETRSAYVWARLNSFLNKYKNIHCIDYKSFCDNPEELTDIIFKKLNLNQTDLTKHHIESVKKYKDPLKKDFNEKEVENKIMIDINQETYEVSER